MNQESLTSLDDPTGNNGVQLSDAAYIQPPPLFRGQPLHPMTAGTELLWMQTRTQGEDIPSYEGLAFVFIHRRNGESKHFDEDRPELFELCWNIAAFRAALVRWLVQENVTQADRGEAIRICHAALEQARASEAEQEPASGKKKRTTRRATSRK